MMNVTVENFDDEVIAASMHALVLVDFWAPQSGPCQVMGALLEKLEVAYGGRFKLAKIDANAQQEISEAFGIRSLPTCVLMSQGKPVDGFTGAVSEAQIKAFLDKHVPEGDVLDAEVTSVEVSDAPAADDPVAIHEALHQALLKNPDDEDARFELAAWRFVSLDTSATIPDICPLNPDPRSNPWSNPDLPPLTAPTVIAPRCCPSMTTT